MLYLLLHSLVTVIPIEAIVKYAVQRWWKQQKVGGCGCLNQILFSVMRVTSMTASLKYLIIPHMHTRTHACTYIHMCTHTYARTRTQHKSTYTYAQHLISVQGYTHKYYNIIIMHGGIAPILYIHIHSIPYLVCKKE